MSVAPKHIVFVTGTRADFGKLEPLAVAARDADYRVSFFVTGMHMMERYGLTKIEVERVTGVGITEFPNQSEGDPHIKARLRQIRTERARQRMMQAVPDADVVITNPTHYAIA